MKIAITSQGTDLNAEIDPRFGRCSYFIIYDTEKENYEVVENSSINLGGGAGIQAAQTISENGVRVLLTGNVGPNAFQTLSAASIEIYTGLSGKISEVVEKFKSGNLEKSSAPSVDSHHGLNKSQASVSAQVSKKRIAVASEDDRGLESNVSAHFGRCPYYTMVEVEGDRIVLSYKVENPFFHAHGQPGQVPTFIRDQGSNVIIAGGMGQRAVEFFNQFGIEVVTGTARKVNDVVNQYIQGRIKGYTPCDHEHEPCD